MELKAETKTIKKLLVRSMVTRHDDLDQISQMIISSWEGKAQSKFLQGVYTLDFPEHRVSIRYVRSV